ncbi:hypothetical protein VNO78_07866 [Psophocarpus tetragonolobus]|uniref:Uncharacterized protein n=1 Tax=Psophocarpus tetragonolobus TaxID=3891 RepID=A0AAN9SU04_PSOTE
MLRLQPDRLLNDLKKHPSRIISNEIKINMSMLFSLALLQLFRKGISGDSQLTHRLLQVLCLVDHFGFSLLQLLHFPFYLSLLFGLSLLAPGRSVVVLTMSFSLAELAP